MAPTTGHRKLLEQLQADGMTTMFGNPGSSEEGLLDEISRFPDIRYILGLQEAALVLMASGYAQATQRPTAVQLHCSVGLGNDKTLVTMRSRLATRGRRNQLNVCKSTAPRAKSGPVCFRGCRDSH